MLYKKKMSKKKIYTKTYVEMVECTIYLLLIMLNLCTIYQKFAKAHEIRNIFIN